MAMRGYFPKLALALATLVVVASSHAQEAPSLEASAAAAQSCVATVRVLDAAQHDEKSLPRVTVCTGVCVEKGWIVTPAFAGSDSQIRLTLPGGEQSAARLRVIDEYSGLALLEADTKELKVLKPANASPKIGGWLVSAAAWGVEQPVISHGILSGRERTVGGMQYPPLLQVDLRTTETSSGAAVVNIAGELLGLVVLVDDGKDRRGFTFAVPVSHVQRLLRARVAQGVVDKPMEAQGPDAEQSRVKEVNTSVVILKRRRPIVGMVLDGIGESVLIKRIEKNSPAEKAGLKVGDIIQAVDGVQIRSVYQAVTPVLYKQPGDTITYQVQQGQEIRQVEVVLGGGVELPRASAETIGQFIRPKVDIEGTGRGVYVKRTPGRAEVAEVLAPAEGAALDEQRLSTPAEQVKLLERALDSYRAVITYQQGQLSQREEERHVTEQHIKTLERDIELLKRRMDEAK